MKQTKIWLAIVALIVAFMAYLPQQSSDNDADNNSQQSTNNQRNTIDGTAKNGKKQDKTTDFSLARTAEGRKSQVIAHTGYTTSWNSNWLIPNWVAYSLTPVKAAGEVERPKRPFEPDPLVHGRTAQHSDYTRSGYDRGHMAPAADMKWSEVAMAESFYLSNVCPQLHAVNDGVWKRIEGKCHRLATQSTVYICSGPIVAARPERIGENGVAVPKQFFKVVCMQRRGRWQAIGFVVPNADCKGSMFQYACSVDEVERITGHDFFYQLPDSIEQAIEAQWGKERDWQ